MNMILASGSPRRREILKNAGYDFRVVTADTDETLPDVISPEEAVVFLAQLKNDAIKCDENEIVVSADTVVSFDGKILGKPRDEEDAVRMLSALSGRIHSVFTGVCIRLGDRKSAFCVETKVEFYPLSQEEIIAYVKTGEPLDKAGAYGIQGKGAVLVKEINGDYLNVVGFPLARFSREIKDFIQ